jgi:hypothetical protein
MASGKQRVGVWCGVQPGAVKGRGRPEMGVNDHEEQERVCEETGGSRLHCPQATVMGWRSLKDVRYFVTHGRLRACGARHLMQARVASAQRRLCISKGSATTATTGDERSERERVSERGGERQRE